MQKTDIELIKGCQAGNQQDFSEIVLRYQKLIYNVVYQLVFDKQEVNDIAQEVFIKIYKNLHLYDSKYKFSTWAAHIASNVCIDRMRKKNHTILPLEELPEINEKGKTPEDEYIHKEKNEELNEIVNRLPQKYRVPIILFYKNGFTYEEMTKILKEPLSIIKNRIYRARIMIKDELIKLRKEGLYEM